MDSSRAHSASGTLASFRTHYGYGAFGQSEDHDERPDFRLPTADCRGEERAAVVAAARSWLGTPYHHAADVRGAGVDCAMLLVRVYCDLGLVEPFDPRPYTRDWFLHRDEERYLGFLLARSREVARPARRRHRALPHRPLLRAMAAS